MKAGLTICAAVAAVAVSAFAIPAGATTPAKGAHKSECSLSQDEQNGGLGASYVYSLKTRNLDCDRAKKLVKDFHKCRHENGGRSGKCPSVDGYDCKQKKLDSSPQLQQWKATCKSGSKKFKQTFGESR